MRYVACVLSVCSYAYNLPFFIFVFDRIPYSVYYSRSSGKSSEVAEAQLRCDGRCLLLGAQQIESILIYCKLLCRRHMSIISC